MESFQYFQGESSSLLLKEFSIVLNRVPVTDNTVYELNEASAHSSDSHTSGTNVDGNRFLTGSVGTSSRLKRKYQA